MGVIVGVMGQARAGKDTIAGYLAKEHDFVRIGLADPMKRFCAEVFDFTDEQLWGDEREKPDQRYPRKVLWCESDAEFPQHKESCYRTEHLTARYALQTLGTEWGRDCYGNVWIEYGVNTAKKLLADPYRRYDPKRGLYWIENPRFGQEVIDEAPLGVVFSDLRFRNEFDAVKSANGILVRVKRTGADGKTGVAGHASEEEQKTIPDSEFHLIITNDGTLEDLYDKIERELVPLIEKAA